MKTKRSLAVVLATMASWGGLAAQAAPTVDARLARAALLETQGDVAGAEQELVAAAAAADAARAGEVDAALRSLRQRTGRAVAVVQDPAAKPTPGGVGAGVGDPIQGLLATLEVGSEAKPEVEAAMRELRALGALAVAPLCAALPKMGLFGARNAATLLYDLDDPRILPALRQRVVDGDAAFAAMLAGDLDKMPTSWSAAMARDLATRDLPAKARFGVLQALIAAGSEEREWQPLLDSLTSATDLHKDLLDWSRKQFGPTVPKLLTLLQSSANEAVRASAVEAALMGNLRVDEDQALLALDRLSAGNAPWVAARLAERHPAWVRVGLRALHRPGFVGNEPWFTQMEWRRRPEEAAPALLDLAWPENQSTDPMRFVFEGMVAHGWRVPPVLDQKLRQMIVRSSGTQVLVSALPEEDEARALVMWHELPAENRRAFVNALVAAGRPWHTVVLAQLGATVSPREVNEAWFQRDWKGLSEDAGRTFVTEVTRLVLVGNGVAYPWNTALAKACASRSELPVGLLLTMVRSGHVAAFQALVERDAAVAFAEVADASRLESPMEMAVLHAVATHGDKRQLPLAIRLFRANPGSGLLDRFFAVHGAGEPSVIELGRAQWPDRGPIVAAEAARRVSSENIVAVISMIPDLHQDVVSALSSVPTPSKEQAPEVRAAIGAMLLRLRTPEAADRGSAGYAMHLLTSFLGRVGDGSDLALLGEVAKASADGLASHIASIMLELAGAKRTTVLAEMLDSKSLRYVQVALQAEELRTDAGLRQRALQATLLLGRQLDGSPLDRLTSADALAMAKEIAAHPDFAEFHPTLAHSALGVLGDARDDALIGLILRGAKHRTSHVRGRVVSELGNNFSDAAARALLELMRDSDDAVRKAAKERLDQIGEYLDARAKWDARKK